MNKIMYIFHSQNRNVTIRAGISMSQNLIFASLALLWLAVSASAQTVMPVPRMQFLDNNGKPLSGCKLYTYEAGTVTALATYTDAALSVANANPVICDSAGRMTVFLKPTSYKFVLKTSAEVTIWTVDNVNASAPFSVNVDISGTAGETINVGQFAYLSTDGKWWLTNANAATSSSTAGRIGVVVSSAVTGQTATIRLAGRVSGLGGLTVGVPYYLSTTVGAVTSTPPTNVRLAGFPDTSSTLVLATEELLPSGATFAAPFKIESGIAADSTYKLENRSGSLYFNGVALATGASVSGTTGTIAKFTGASTVGNSSILTESGTTLTLANSTTIAGTPLTASGLWSWTANGVYQFGTGGGDNRIVSRSNAPYAFAATNSGATNTYYFGISGNDGVLSDTAGAEHFRIAQDGTVTITRDEPTHTDPFFRLTNSNASGQTGLEYVINGTLRGKVRADYLGNFAYVVNGGDHVWFTGGDVGTGTERMRVSATGTLTIPGNTTHGDATSDVVTNAGRYNSATGQPGFLAYNSADDSGVSGTVDFDTEVYDETGDFAADTFTAPVTGRYQFCTNVYAVNTSGGTVTFVIQLNTTGGNYIMGEQQIANSATGAPGTCIIVPMTATNTATITWAGNVTIGLTGQRASWFSGRLVP